MKKIIFLIVTCILFACQINAQSNPYSPNLPNVLPTSPTSRVLEKFLGYPISHSTGTVHVNIPLYTLDVHNVSIPMELKHHTSGVKINDPIGVVGRNWSLFPGFKITRTMVGKPDEKFPVTDKGDRPSIVDQICLSAPYRNDECVIDRGIETNLRMDSQYDLFQVHMPGIETSFIIKRINNTDVVEMITDKPYKITPLIDTPTNYINQRIYAFEILNDQGIKYIFGEALPIRNTSNFVEYTSTFNGAYISGWMLREIIFPNDEKINFTYIEVREDVPTFSECKIILDNGRALSMQNCHYDPMVNTSTGSNSPFWRILGNVGYTITDSNGSQSAQAYHANVSRVPSTIISENAIINFIYNSNMLKSVTVKNKDNAVARNISLTYNPTNELLKKIDIAGEGSYIFNYKDETNTAIKTACFDWWGYYNGKTSSGKFPYINIDLIITRNNMSIPGSQTVGNGADRNPDENFMDARALQEVIYPTGGSFKIKYQAHRYKIDGIEKIGGGIRVKSTESFDPVSGKTITRNYTYEDGKFVGKHYPDIYSLITTREICTLDQGTSKIRQRIISVFPQDILSKSGTMPVWYPKVIETTEEGKIEYIYDYKTDEYQTQDRSQSLPLTSNQERIPYKINRLVYASPWIISEIKYKKTADSYEKVQTTTNTYVENTSTERGLVIIPFMHKFNGTSNCEFLATMTGCSNKYYQLFGSPVTYKRYYITTGSHSLASTEKVSYIGAESIVEKTSFTYDSERPYNVSQKTMLCSDGNQLIEKYYYSNNTIPNKSVLTTSQQSCINLLTQQNYKTAVVQKIMEKNDTRLYSELTGFMSKRDKLIRPQTVYYQKGTGAFEKRMEYKKYDEYGNPVHIIKDENEEIIYVWGYKGQYTVAEIRGTTYDDVSNIAGLPEDTSEYGAESPFYGLIVRAYCTDALVTTYIYEPLIGIKAIVYPNENALFYKYDNYGRLKNIEDVNEKILEEYKYNIKQ